MHVRINSLEPTFIECIITDDETLGICIANKSNMHRNDATQMNQNRKTTSTISQNSNHFIRHIWHFQFSKQKLPWDSC